MYALALTMDRLSTVEVGGIEVERRLRPRGGVLESLWRLAFRFTLGRQIAALAQLQQGFIEHLRLIDVNTLPDDSLSEISRRLFRIVRRNDQILGEGRSLPFYREEDFRWIAAQQNDLDSLAESYALSASPEKRAQIDLWITEAPSGTVEEDWRDFVGSLQD